MIDTILILSTMSWEYFVMAIRARVVQIYGWESERLAQSQCSAVLKVHGDKGVLLQRENWDLCLFLMLGCGDPKKTRMDVAVSERVNEKLGGVEKVVCWFLRWGREVKAGFD